ncbi:MAG: S41 family peptidase [Deltaproteobacteria bacterium]|nr:S41 family peptidase [Deltaproteobacteria bacterium]
MGITKKKFLIDIFLAFILVSGIILVHGRFGSVKAGTDNTDEVYENIEIFTEVLRQIQENYVEPKDPKELIQGAIKGMVQSLDPHSSFLTREEHQELLIETKGSFSGVGIEISIRDNMLTVVAPIEGSPAYKAGIRAGDKIIKINDDSTADMSLSEAVKRIRGKKGTKVRLTVIREGEDKPIEFTIVRDVIPLRSVRYYRLTPEIGYVRISTFQSKTTKDLSKALNELEKNASLKGLILDLRNNPGGLLSQAIEVSDLFLESGVIVSTRGRNQSQNMEVRAHKNRKPRNYPIIVLVNSGSASASEIVAGALQDNRKALILGTKTFGKGSVQTIVSLSDGSGLRLTTARYYTPSGRSIQLSGIIPDIELEFEPPTSTQEEEDKGKALREEDLQGHILPADNDRNGKAPGQKGKTEKDKRVERLLKRDNQVRYALQLLQSWKIFSQIGKE